METVDRTMWSSIEWMLQNDITDVLFESFTHTAEDGAFVELLPGGDAITVRFHDCAVFH